MRQLSGLLNSQAETLTPMLLDLTDATGSSADLVKVKVTTLRGAA